MVASSTDRALQAFRRLLADAPSGPQAKVDALVALSQRTVFVATWTEDGEDYRTLVNSNGQNALPLFTDEHELQTAAERFGWLDESGRVPHREVGARSALRHALSRGIGFVVVDIMADYSLEAGQAEIKPLVSARHRSDSSGPFAGVGRISSSMMQAVRVTPSGGIPRPMTPEDGMKPPGTPARGASPPAEVPRQAPPPPAPDATFGGSQSGTLAFVPLAAPPQDLLLDALEDVLREYPEVEWAAFCSASRGPAAPLPTIGVMVDSAFRQRIGEIARGLQAAGNATGASLDVVFLDTPELMREARANGKIFFPWRR
ncbi:MAG: SseB family protein [Deltaproteobacteria bacterium]|nr:SseB family protein [Deltaproteobacteria bacterium]